MELDHLAVTGETLEAAAGHVEAALGAGLAPGGQHARYGTHNRLLGLGAGLYLEAIAVDPGADRPAEARWFGLDDLAGPPRLAAWICRVPDLDAALAAAPEGAGRIVALERSDLRWRMAVPESGHLPFDGMFPALIEWEGPAHPSARLPDVGCRLGVLEVAHPRAGALRGALAGLADSRVRIVEGVPGLRAVIDTPGGERGLA
ncbi:MAG: VOC family protein [Paracoccaceae bacterium]